MASKIVPIAFSEGTIVSDHVATDGRDDLCVRASPVAPDKEPLS
jgi:hypothetical protein